MWPDGKTFAFTVFDDPDAQTCEHGKRIYEVATQQAGLKKIDHVVVTHFHTDHYGGLADLAKLIPLGTLHDHDITTAPPEKV